MSRRVKLAILAVVVCSLALWAGISAAFSEAHPSANAEAPSSAVTYGTPATLGSDESPDPTDDASVSASPHPSAHSSPHSALSIAEPPRLGKTALAVLALLAVHDQASGAGYQRTQDFGTAWLDVEHNGCDTRDDILKRDLSKVVLNGCKVMSGRFVDPYTGDAMTFKRGNDTSALVQIDHIVALMNAWVTGAQQLTQQQREDLANDPTNLLAVDGSANEQKSDADAANWLPAYAPVRCEYAARQVSVKYAYGLWVTSSEKAALTKVLDGCPDQPAYRSALVSKPLASAAGSGSGSGADSSAGSGGADGGPATPAASPADVYYANCSAAYAAGVDHIKRGDPGYRAALDRDDDGVACEG